jgi:hypothetical protein
MMENFLPQLRREIMAQGYDEATASRYAVLLGDTPCRDAVGNLVVMDGDEVLATLPPLQFYEEPPQ